MQVCIRYSEKAKRFKKGLFAAAKRPPASKTMPQKQTEQLASQRAWHSLAAGAIERLVRAGFQKKTGNNKGAAPSGEAAGLRTLKCEMRSSLAHCAGSPKMTAVCGFCPAFLLSWRIFNVRYFRPMGSGNAQ